MPLIPAAAITRQLRQPTGLIGGVLLPRLFNWRNAALNNLALEKLALAPADWVLEVGFGGGYLLGRMSVGASKGVLIGFDASPAMVRFTARRHRRLVETGRLRLGCASAEALPLQDATVNKACTVNTLFYVADPLGAVKELRRVLSEAGQAIVCLTLRHSLEDRDFAKQDLNLFDVQDVEDMMATAGFRDVHTITASDRWRQFVCATGVKSS